MSMAENTAYFDSITANRSMQLSEEEQLAGSGMLSLETQEEFNEDSFYTFSRGAERAQHLFRLILGKRAVA